MKEALNTHLQPGCPIFVEIGEAKEKLFSKIIGFQDGKYVIISQPSTANAITPKLTIGSTAVIKYVYEGSIIAFRTPVVEQIQHPDQLVFVNFPHEVTRQNLRAQKRYTCSFPVKFRKANEAVEATLVDISLGGCCSSIDNVAVSHMETPPVVGDDIELAIQRPGANTWASLTGKVSSTFGRNDKTHYGIAFQQKNSETENLIRQMIFQSLPV